MIKGNDSESVFWKYFYELQKIYTDTKTFDRDELLFQSIVYDLTAIQWARVNEVYFSK
jgi:hypothetical protein